MSGSLVDPLSSEIAQLSKAELIAQLQQARRDAQRAAQSSSISAPISTPISSSISISDAQPPVDRDALVRELQHMHELLSSKADVITAHAAATAALAQQHKSSIELEQEIAALQQAIESERLRKEHLSSQHHLEVQSLRAKLEADRVEKENAARLLAARIAQVKMEIQELKSASRRSKQRAQERHARLTDEQYADAAKQEAHLNLLKQKRDAWEQQQQRETDRSSSSSPSSSSSSPPNQHITDSSHSSHAHEQQARPLKSFTLDHSSSLQFMWPGSPSNAWCEPELCIRHVLRLDSSFRIVTQPDHRRVRLKSQPFAQGGMRLAYVCEDLTSQAAQGVVYRLVAKESMYAGQRFNSLPAFYGEVRAQLVARAFAQRFNRLNPPKFLQFLAPMIYEFPQRLDPDRRYMCVELFLPAFCHWSWHDSAQQMMITDLQGVGYILTDPQIHSTHQQGSGAGSFGTGGGDADAMNDFFKQHHCNEICHSFQLSPHPAQPRSSPSLDTGVTRAHLQYATEMMGECGHMFVLQVKDRPAYLEAQSRMCCPACAKNQQAIPFFPKER